MSLWQNVPRAQTAPFVAYLRQASEPDALSAAVRPAEGTVVPTAVAHLRTAWRWLERMRATQTANRRLRVTETVSLGEKRFVSIVQVDGAQFLIGSSATNVQLLAQLDPPSGERTAPSAAKAEESR